MKRVCKVGGLVIAVVLIFLSIGTAQPLAQSGFRISGRQLVDANGNNFIIRGISHAHTWYTGQTSAFANIKSVGANAVRVVLSSGDRWTRNDANDVANVIQLCKDNRLICVLEVHDTTGYGEEGAAISLSQAVSYWTSIQSVLTGQEAYIIINIGNEPYGNSNTSGWVSDTRSAITAMRNAGFDHTLMVDAPNWGQDWEFIMRDNAASLFSADPDKNTIFSIHMYGVFDTASEVQSYISSFVSAGLPLVIGEFGDNHSDGDPDEDAIMSYAQSNGIGYIGWSWCGNSGGVEYLDMVNNWDPNSLTSWGSRIVNGANGLAQTSQECSVYGGPVPTATRTPTTPPGATPTRTPTTPPQATPTPTSAPGQPCSPATARSLPFTQNGSGTYCWSVSQAPNYINSWNLATLEVNGVDFTNQWAGASSLPAPISGLYYIYYVSNYSWGHFEAAEGTTPPQPTPTSPPQATPTRTPTTPPQATPTRTPTRTPTSPPQATPTRTPTRTPTTPPQPTSTPSDCLPDGARCTSNEECCSGICGGSWWRRTCQPSTSPTPTSPPQATPTRTPTSPPQATPTRTPTSPPGPTATPTQPAGQPCSPATSQSLPFTYNGSGQHCWVFGAAPAYINSWNLALLEVNGVDFTNKWASAAQLPPAISGQYYVQYDGNWTWSHFEAAGP